MNTIEKTKIGFQHLVSATSHGVDYCSAYTAVVTHDKLSDCDAQQMTEMFNAREKSIIRLAEIRADLSAHEEDAPVPAWYESRRILAAERDAILAMLRA